MCTFRGALPRCTTATKAEREIEFRLNVVDRDEKAFNKNVFFARQPHNS